VVTEKNFKNQNLKNFKKTKQDLSVFDFCDPDFNYYERCLSGTRYSYPDMLADSVFCLIGETYNHTHLLNFFDALKFNCIPVLVFDEFILPFEEKIDWKSTIVRVREAHVDNLVEIIAQVTHDAAIMMLVNIEAVYTNYFSSISNITMTTLEILDSRIFKKQHLN
jgi:hypothetical protein